MSGRPACRCRSRASRCRVIPASSRWATAPSGSSPTMAWARAPIRRIPCCTSTATKWIGPTARSVRSPDHWAAATPGAPGATYSNVNLRRSKGYEGFASSKGGKFLYGLLEGPLWDAEKKDWEKVDGKEASRILEFDVAAEKFTGRYWQYVFEQNGNAIGDFNMIDPTSGLITERDNGEGTPDKACPQGTRGENCFPDVAKFKRVYKIELIRQ